MFPSQHILLGFFFSILLFIIFPGITLVGISIVFLSSFLIDVDHYIYYSYKNKDYSLKNAYNWFIDKRGRFFSLSREQRNHIYSGFFFLHGVEILIVLILFYFLFSNYFLFIFIGFAFHLLFDFVDQTLYWDRIDKFSLIYDFFKFRKYHFL
jgi:hypothetical protein